jgi:hypothetical protein
MTHGPPRIDEQALQHAVAETAAGVLLQAYLEDPSRAQGNPTSADFLAALRKPEGCLVRRRDAIAALRALAAADCGRFRHGRRGLATRLEWYDTPLNAARLAFPEIQAEPASAATSGAPGVDNPAVGAPSAVVPDGTYELRFPLRRGFEVSLKLPVDLDTDERQRLSMAISALPAS